jgi:hypothetical protein
MLDFNNHLSSEVRHLAFRKSNEQATWQDEIKKQHRIDIEHSAEEFTRNNILSNLARALFSPYNQWKRARRPSPGLMPQASSQHKAG